MRVRQVETRIADHIIIVIDAVLVVLHRLIVTELFIELVQSGVHLSLVWHIIPLRFRAHVTVWTDIWMVLNIRRWGPKTTAL